MNFQVALVPVTAFEQNCALLFDRDTKRGVVVDPGGDLDRIVNAIEQNDLTIERILLTHGHLDHAGGAMKLKEMLGVEIIGPHRHDKAICDCIAGIAASYGMGCSFENVKPDQWLQEGDTVDIAGVPFNVLHCPGHSPGHVVFHSPDLRFAHVGDVLFRGSVGRTDLPGGDHNTLIASIREKLLPLGDDTQFLCGHGPGGTIGQERMTNPFLRHTEAAE